MTRIVAKGLALASAVGISCGAILFALPPTDNTFLAAIEDKWRLAEETPSPKILIVGGSNTAFGFDSRRIHEAFGRPVVNMGLNAGLGLDYMLAEVRPFLGDGDVVVISPEYEQFYGTTFHGGRVLLETIRLYPPAAKHMHSIGQVLGLMRGFPNYFQDRIRELYLDRHRTPEQQRRRRQHPVYRRDAFNEFGDVESHVDEEAPTRPIPAMDFLGALRGERPDLERRTVRELEDFHEFAREEGARVFIVPPTIPTYYYDRDSVAVERVYERLRAESTVPVLGTPTSQTAPDDHFFDTAYHMSGKGRDARTGRLIRLLRERLAVRRVRAGR